jgi:hypothetical protein
MKTYKYIVINKNNMKRLNYFAEENSVTGYLWGRRLNGILVIVNEHTVIDIGKLGTGDLFTIRKVLRDAEQGDGKYTMPQDDKLLANCPFSTRFSADIIRRTRKALKNDAAGNDRCTMTDLDLACDMLDELERLNQRLTT